MAESVNVLIPKEEVDKKIREMAEQIDKDYAGGEIRMICILKGGVFFMTELAKHVKTSCTFDFMSISSYGNGTESTGRVKIVKDLDEPIEGQDVLVVEDIVDSGRTLTYLVDILKNRKPKSIRLCTLLDKPDRREMEIKVDYTGFQIPDAFVVGYGLDYQQRYRNMPFIGVVEL